MTEGGDVGSAIKGAEGGAESKRVIGNHVEIVDSSDCEKKGLTIDKGNIYSTKRT